MPTKRTPENRQKLIDLLRTTGLSMKKASESIGLGYSTLKAWRSDDEDLVTEMEQARAQYFEGLQRDITNDGKPSDKIKMMQVLDPEEYGDRRTVVHEIVLEMPGLLPGKAMEALAEVNWDEMDKRAAKGELTDGDKELLGLPEEIIDVGPDDEVDED